MVFTIRGNTGTLRRGGSFLFSLSVHAAVLGWVILSAALGLDLKPKADFDPEDHPVPMKITWYHLQTRIPNVRPLDAQPAKRPPRAVRKLDQNLIAGKKESPTPPQKIWVPDPPKAEIPKPKLEALPNLIAVAPEVKRPLRRFEPPPVAPEKPKPHEKLPDAPDVALKAATITPADSPIAMTLPRAVRTFVAPPDAHRPAPEQEVEPIAPPEVTPEVAPAPTMAIVGLDPAKTVDIPKPPQPRDAAFSAGPKPNPEGESAPASRALLRVPSLYASGGPKDVHPLTAADLAPTSEKNLLAAMGMGGTPRPRVGPPPGPHAPHVSSSPDPRMNGRIVYMMAIQMPNVTSFSGSWMVWFAEHQPLPGAPPADMRGPEPMRKVDPKYIADAANERVEGIVRLTAVIRKDGTIDDVELLKHLDDRLDRSAEEALAKWRFEPARRDGEPVDVDAVFEIPFRLAPRTSAR